MDNMFDLTGRVAVVTGGSRGLGREMVMAFARHGADVVIASRKVDACEALAAEVITETGRRATPTAFHAGRWDDCEALHRLVYDEYGRCDVLVNNAANDKRHTTGEVTEEFWDWSQSINLKAYFFACQAAAKHMKENGKGAIINFSSISYMMGNSGYPAYTTANGGITAMTRSLAREFGPDRIRVNALAPGWVLTQKQKDLWVTPDGLAAHLDRQCLKDTLAPEDIVGGTLFLASDSAKMMTGQVLVIDGGVVVTG